MATIFTEIGLFDRHRAKNKLASFWDAVYIHPWMASKWILDFQTSENAMQHFVSWAHYSTFIYLSLWCGVNHDYDDYNV